MMAQNNKLCPLAKGIAAGLKQAIDYAKGEPTSRTRETIVYSVDAKAIPGKTGYVAKRICICLQDSAGYPSELGATPASS